MSLTPAQEETMKGLCANFVTGFMALPEEARNKYIAEKTANVGKPLSECEDYQKTCEIFLSFDADKDGKLSKSEFAEYLKAHDAHRAQQYGAFYQAGEADQ